MTPWVADLRRPSDFYEEFLLSEESAHRQVPSLRPAGPAVPRHPSPQLRGPVWTARPGTSVALRFPAEGFCEGNADCVIKQ